MRASTIFAAVRLAFGKASALLAGRQRTFIHQDEWESDCHSAVTSNVTNNDASVKVNDTWMTPSRNDGP